MTSSAEDGGSSEPDATHMTSVTVMRSSAADRNKAAILDALRDYVIVSDKPSRVLEIASGTGQHVSHFAEFLSHVTWQPSECDAKSIKSIEGYIQITQRTNILDPVWIDTRTDPDVWSEGRAGRLSGSYDVILSINLLHFCEWSATEGLFKGSERFLKPGGALVTYGPFKVNGEVCPESNVQFDDMLRHQNNEWGLRDTRELSLLAESHGMSLEKMIDMPSNHKMLVFRKSSN